MDQPTQAGSGPNNVVVVLLDSLNRHMLGAYGGAEFETPNLDRFAASAVRFARHYTGSLPCMPARHDILCGALDFLWRAWGSVEIWEDAITYALRETGVTTQLISDHPHLFETGGENYHTDFTAWDYLRGHEGDAWKTRPDPSWAGAPSFGRRWMPYDNSRGWFREEADFPGPKTMAAATRWIDGNAGAPEYRKDGRFFLFVDEFDPHEPFDTPEPWASKYDPKWEGAHMIWPPYAVGAQARGILDERQARQIRSQYGAKLSMIDHWLGKLLHAIDAKGLSDDTMVMVCTDHGHYLGEKDIWGKPGCPIYQPMAHIPLMIRAPGVVPGVCDALTTAVDIFATLADVFGVTLRQRTHGRSLAPLLRGEATSVRESLLTGVWGRDIVLVTGRHKYVRGPAGENAPLSMLSNRWSTMPTHGAIDPRTALPLPDSRAFLDRMPGSDVPVIHQRWDAGENVPYWARYRSGGNHVYDLANDPAEHENLAGGALEATLAEQLRAALVELEVPKTQFERLGFSPLRGGSGVGLPAKPGSRREPPTRSLRDYPPLQGEGSPTSRCKTVAPAASSVSKPELNHGSRCLTYCLGILLAGGLVLASDSRSNAGVDQVQRVSKLTLITVPGERVISILSAGNLATTQSVVTELRQAAGRGQPGQDVRLAHTMFDVAEMVGVKLREVGERDAKYVEPYGDPSASFLVAGEIAGDGPRLFEVYSAGNFVEASPRNCFLQIGETKYGKPILDRGLMFESTLEHAAKLALLSFDATMRSNLSVGPPLDLLRYQAGSLSTRNLITLGEQDAYWRTLRDDYSAGLTALVDALPAPPNHA